MGWLTGLLLKGIAKMGLIEKLAALAVDILLPMPEARAWDAPRQRPEAKKVDRERPPTTINIAGQAWKEVGDLAWERAGTGDMAGRRGDMTDSDYDEIDLSRTNGKYPLDVDKYIAVKRYWAEGLSNRQITGALKGVRGFSGSVVDVYCAAINRAAAAPSGAKRGAAGAGTAPTGAAQNTSKTYTNG